MKTIEQLIREHWSLLFDEINKIECDNLHELSITYMNSDGLTIQKSWHDSQDRLEEEATTLSD